MSEVVIRIDKFNEVKAKLAPALQKGVDAVGEAVLQRAKQGIVQQNAVDTGALLNSGYIENPKVSGREEAEEAATAAAASPGKHSGKPHELEFADRGEKPSGKVWARVAFAVDYANYIELGHGGRGSGKGAPARPFLRPAVEEVRLEAETIVEAVLRKEIG